MSAICTCAGLLSSGCCTGRVVSPTIVCCHRSASTIYHHQQQQSTCALQHMCTVRNPPMQATPNTPCHSVDDVVGHVSSHQWNNAGVDRISLAVVALESHVAKLGLHSTCSHTRFIRMHADAPSCRYVVDHERRHGDHTCRCVDREFKHRHQCEETATRVTINDGLLLAANPPKFPESPPGQPQQPGEMAVTRMLVPTRSCRDAVVKASTANLLAQ